MARWAIAIHGGAGVDPNLPEHRQEEAKRVLARCLQVGVDLLRAGASALDVVEAVVRELETDPCFNSGRGSALTRAGTVEMEASIMDGRGRRCGAVSGVSTVRNPVSLARRVMDKSPHSYLAFAGAEDFARDQGLEVVDNSYFITEENVGMLKLAKEANTILFDYRVPLTGADTCSALAAATESHHGSNGGMVMNGLPISIYAPETVGCAVVDCNGFTAAATSTGGLMNRGGASLALGPGPLQRYSSVQYKTVTVLLQSTKELHCTPRAQAPPAWGLSPPLLMNKMTGRIGDSPLIGAGTYACAHCAVSCTGEGEAIIRSTLARDVAAVMEYKGLPLQDAVDFCVKERLDEGFAGLIAVSGTGEVAYGFNCTGMFRGCATEDGFMEVGIWE